MDQEQVVANGYLSILSKFLGLLEQKKLTVTLKARSDEIMAQEPERKIALYGSLRLEQSNLA